VNSNILETFCNDCNLSDKILGTFKQNCYVYKLNQIAIHLYLPKKQELYMKPKICDNKQLKCTHDHQYRKVKFYIIILDSAIHILMSTCRLLCEKIILVLSSLLLLIFEGLLLISNWTNDDKRSETLSSILTRSFLI